MAEIAVDVLIGLLAGLRNVIQGNEQLRGECKRLTETMSVIGHLLDDISKLPQKHPSLQSAFRLTKQIADDISRALARLVQKPQKKGIAGTVTYHFQRLQTQSRAKEIVKELQSQEEMLHKAMVILTTSMTAANLSLASAAAAAAAANISEEEKKMSPVRMILGASEDACKFWTTHFGEEAASVSWSQFEEALKKAGVYATLNEEDLVVIRLYLDENKDGSITTYEMAKWVGSGSLKEALDRDKKAAAGDAKTTAAGEPGVAAGTGEGEEGEPPLPDLIWVDPHPENNEDIIADCVKRRLTVVCVDTAADATAIFKAKPELLRSQTVRCITNNYKWELNGEGEKKDANLSAAEELIRFLRRRRSNIPVLIYCGSTYDLAQAFLKADPVAYRNCRATRDYADAEKFAFLGARAWE